MEWMVMYAWVPAGTEPDGLDPQRVKYVWVPARTRGEALAKARSHAEREDRSASDTLAMDVFSVIGNRDDLAALALKGVRKP